MGEDGVTQGRIGKTGKHRDLDGCDNFAGLYTEGGEAENATALGIDKGFQKASSLGVGEQSAQKKTPAKRLRCPRQTTALCILKHCTKCNRWSDWA